MVTLYNAVSADGFIAREDGSEDFIPDSLWSDFLNMCRQNDTVVIGRNTYEAIQKYPKEMRNEFEELDAKKIVVTNDSGFAPKGGYLVAHSPKEAVGLGKNILFSSGPTLNTSALKDGLIEAVVLNVLPKKIGNGLKVFNAKANLKLISEKDMGVGRILRKYSVLKIV